MTSGSVCTLYRGVATDLVSTGPLFGQLEIFSDVKMIVTIDHKIRASTYYTMGYNYTVPTTEKLINQSDYASTTL